VPVVFTNPVNVNANILGKDSFFDNIADDLCVGKRATRRVFSNLSKTIETKFKRASHAHPCIESRQLYQAHKCLAIRKTAVRGPPKSQVPCSDNNWPAIHPRRAEVRKDGVLVQAGRSRIAQCGVSGFVTLRAGGHIGLWRTVALRRRREARYRSIQARRLLCQFLSGEPPAPIQVALISASGVRLRWLLPWRGGRCHGAAVGGRVAVEDVRRLAAKKGRCSKGQSRSSCRPLLGNIDRLLFPTWIVPAVRRYRSGLYLGLVEGCQVTVVARGVEALDFASSSKSRHDVRALRTKPQPTASWPNCAQTSSR
jgi:hypothetical protein